MLTIKLPYSSSKENKEIIFNFQKNQNNLTKFIFNRLKDTNYQINDKEIRNQIKDLNNIFIDSWFKDSALIKAKAMFNASEEYDRKVIFGGKKLFIKRCQNKISKKDIQIEIKIPKAKHIRKDYLQRIQDLAIKRLIPFTFSINQERIFISFEELMPSDLIKINKKQNRIMALDLNPNFIGYSIIDWTNEEKFNIIKTGLISIKEINDKEFNIKSIKYELKKQGIFGEARKELFYKKYSHIKNKRKHEIVEVAKQLYNIGKSHNIEYFSIEKLDMKSKGSAFCLITLR